MSETDSLVNPLRVGIIGMGNAGLLHLRALRDQIIPGAEPTAICCRADRAAEIADLLSPEAAVFETDQAMFASGACDAVIIATPHPLHPQQTIAALEAGLHVMCEKPAGVRASQARAMAAAARGSGRAYAMNFNRRLVPLNAAVRDLVHSGAIGSIQRASFTSTAWLRVQAYYDSSPWRGTWAGEGGGLLLNQLPHTLDLWAWILGMPTRLQATCSFGKHHDIEVEDEVHVQAECANGAIVTLTGSTGEAPGIDRIEIVGDRGTIIAEHDQLHLTTLQDNVGNFIRSAPPGFDQLPAKTQIMRFDTQGDLIAGMMRNFVAHIREGVPLLAPGEDGIASLDLANAILLSAWEGRWVNLPTDEIAFDRELTSRQRRSNRRGIAASTVMKLEQSFVKPIPS